MHLSPRARTRTITTVFVITLAAVAAYAAINYKSGPNFTIQNFDLVTTGELSGLGGTAHVTVDAVGTANGTCTNKGGNTVPAQATSVDASGTSGPIHPDSNGRSTFSVTALPAASGNPCPNGNWHFTITSVEYTSATVTVTASSQSRVDSFTLSNCIQTDPNVETFCSATPTT